MKKIKEVYKKHERIIIYLLFGAITTLVNINIYKLCYEICGISNVVSNIISWIISVSVAFFTNKFFVFKSEEKIFKKVFNEAVSFFACRIGTGFIDLILMYILVDVLNFNGTIMKVLVNVIVIVLNFINSKLFVFKNK